MSSGLQISLAGNITDFQEFTFISRQARWVKFTAQKVHGYSGGVGIQDIEIYNELCKPSKYALWAYLNQKKLITRPCTQGELVPRGLLLRWLDSSYKVAKIA